MDKPLLLLKQLRDLLVPITVVGLVPYLLRNTGSGSFIPDLAWLKLVAVVIMIPALAVFAYTIYYFHTKGKGTLAPWSEKEQLVVAGPYRYVRNPMIAALLVVLLCEALLYHSTGILFYALFFYAVNTFYFMLSEEPFLTEKFGEDYTRYKKHVRRWWPSFHAYGKDY